MSRVRIWLRDWRRGYTDDDMRSVFAKLQQVQAGGTVEMSNREWAAFKAAKGWN